MTAQVHESDERTLVQREFAVSVTLVGDEELVTHSPRP